MSHFIKTSLKKRAVRWPVFGLLGAFLVFGLVFTVRIVLANPIFTVSIDPVAVDAGQTKDLVFNVSKVSGTTALQTVAISVQGTGFSGPTSVQCPAGWSVIPAMPPILNGYVCNSQNGSGLDNPQIILKGMTAPSSTGIKDFSVSVRNTDLDGEGNPNPATENQNASITVKNLSATVTINPATANTGQARDYSLLITNDTGDFVDSINGISGILNGFVVNSCSAEGWSICNKSGNSFSLSGGTLAPGSPITVSVNATAPDGAGSQAVSATITGALGKTVAAPVAPGTIEVQAPANLEAGIINSDINFISNVSGSNNIAIISVEVTNSGGATANNIVKSLAIKRGVDNISGQFDISDELSGVTEIAGDGATQIFSWNVEALAGAVEGLDAAEISIQYGDSNDSIVNLTETQTNDGIFTVDNTVPVLNTVSIVSDNTNPALAKPGDTVILTMMANENIQAPEVVIAGHTVTPSGSGASWTASYDMVESDNNGVVSFTITAKDLAGNAVGSVTSTTEPATSVTYDKILPTFSSINAIPALAKLGTAVTVSFTASEPLLSDPAVAIGGGAAIKDSASVAPDYIYTRTLDNSETEGLATVSISGTDLAGNTSTDTTASINTDFTNPTVALTYTPDRPVKDADSVTVTATFSEELSGTPKISIDTPTTDIDNADLSGAGTVWSYTWDVPAGNGSVAITISASDPAGNLNSPATNNSRIIDNTKPTSDINSPAASSWQNTDFIMNVTDTDANGVAERYYRVYSDANGNGDFSESEMTKNWTLRDDGNISITVGEEMDCRVQGENKCKIQVKAIDSAGNDNWVSPWKNVIVNIDWTAPDPASIVIAAGAIVIKDATPVLTLTPGAIAPDNMRFSCNGIAWSEWVGWATSYDGFNLATGAGCAAGDGAKTVYVSVKDAHGNEQATINSDSIIYDSDDNLTVGAGGDFTAIQEAINNATAGDTVEVFSGVYAENLTIDKQVNLEGVLAGTEGDEDRSEESEIHGYIKIASDNITIDGFKIVDGAQVPSWDKAGIQIVSGKSGHHIVNNLFIRSGSAPLGFDGFRGITNDYSGVSSLEIARNKFVGWHSGIFLQNATATVTDNVMEANMVGMSVDGPNSVIVTDNEFVNNAFEGVGTGDGLSGSYSLVLNENKFEGNGTMPDGMTVHNYSSAFTVNAVNNWWGAAVPDFTVITAGDIDHDPWYLDEEMDTLSSEVGTDEIFVETEAESGNNGHYWGFNAFATIQEGIDAVDTSGTEGGTVNVAAGVYTEGFSVVSKSNLNIVGSGVDSTIIRPVSLINSGVGHKYTANSLVVALVNNSTGININGMTIESGSSAPGSGGADSIVLWNASTGTIDGSAITGTYAINGNQTGQGLGVDAGSGETTTLTVSDTSISGFQKNAIDAVNGNANGATGAGTINLTVDECVITGVGPTTTIAQNGVLVWNQGGGTVTGTVSDTVISGFDYTPAGTESAGILTYGSATMPTIENTDFNNCELSISAYGGGNINAITGNTFNGVSPASATLTQLAAIENTFRDKQDDSVYGAVYLLANTVIATQEKGLQKAINAVGAGDIIKAAEGTYSGNVNINKSVSIVGPNNGINPNSGTRGIEAIVNGGITLASDNITIDGFTITNPAGKQGIYSQDHNGIVIQNNTISDIGSSDSSTSGTNFGVAAVSSSAAVNGFTVKNNKFNQITGGAFKSAVAIAAGWSTGSEDITSLVIENNVISGITSNTGEYSAGGRGAYGILINHGTGTTGKTVSPDVLNNTINNLEGLWAHAIGLEGNTPNAIVAGNIISNLTDYKTPSDAVGVQFEDNDSADTVTLENNKFGTSVAVGVQNVVSGKIVDASANWWNSPTGPTHASNPGGTGNSVSDNVNFRPWYTNSELADLDQAVPTVTVAALTTNDRTPALQGTVNDNKALTDLEIIVNVNGADYVAANNGDGTWVLANDAIASLADGTYEVMVSAEDKAGNIGTDTSNNELTIDATAPIIFALSVSPDPGTAKVGSIITLTITADDNAYSAEEIIINGVDITASFHDNGDNTYTATYNVAEGNNDVISGAITASAVLKDSNENENSAFTTVSANSLSIDAHTPTITSIISDATAEGWLKVGDEITFTLAPSQTEPGVTVSGYYNGVSLSWGITNGGATYTAVYQIEEGDNDQISAPLQISAITITDAAGNTSAPAEGSDIQKKIDANTPEVQLISLFTGRTLSAGETVTIDWTPLADAGFGATPIRIEFSKNGTDNWLDVILGTENDGRYNWLVPNENTSNSAIRVTATDQAGNSDFEPSSPFSISYIVDDSEPIVSITNPDSGSSYVGNTPLEVMWTASDNKTSASNLDVLLEYSVTNSGGSRTWTTLYSGKNNNGGVYFWNVPDEPTTTGLLRITVTDAAGKSTPAYSPIFTITEAPVYICAETAPGSGHWECDINLNEGWNLVSLPVIVPDETLTTVLGGVMDNLDTVQYYVSDAVGWISYNPNSSNPALTTIEDGKGYWINMDVADTLTVTGVKSMAGSGAPGSPLSYSVIQGWNLIGFKSTISMPSVDYLNGLNSGTWTLLDAGENILNNEDMDSGHGYWLKTTTPGSITPGAN